MLAGLSGLYIFKIPPCFWAHATSAVNIARNNEPAAENPRRFRFIRVPPLAFARSSGPFFLGILNEACSRTLLSQAHCRALVQKCRYFGVYHRSIEGTGWRVYALTVNLHPHLSRSPLPSPGQS